MASDAELAEYVCDQLRDAGTIRSRKLFGEYAFYCDEKLVALLSDDHLFVKPTDGGRSFIGEPAMAPPYPGAKPYFLVDDWIDDREWLGALVSVTARELPEPKPKKPRVAKSSVRDEHSPHTSP